MGTVRDTLTNMWGDALEVNASDRTSRYTIDYTLPDSYVYSHCKLVALVSNYDSEDVNNCKVLNAAESAFLDEVPGELAGNASSTSRSASVPPVEAPMQTTISVVRLIARPVGGGRTASAVSFCAGLSLVWARRAPSRALAAPFTVSRIIICASFR